MDSIIVTRRPPKIRKKLFSLLITEFGIPAITTRYLLFCAILRKSAKKVLAKISKNWSAYFSWVRHPHRHSHYNWFFTQYSTQKLKSRRIRLSKTGVLLSKIITPSFKYWSLPNHFEEKLSTIFYKSKMHTKTCSRQQNTSKILVKYFTQYTSNLNEPLRSAYHLEHSTIFQDITFSVVSHSYQNRRPCCQKVWYFSNFFQSQNVQKCVGSNTIHGTNMQQGYYCI